MRSIRIVGRSIVDFIRDDGLILAGSISYFTMMALVPFCLFLITLFGYLLGQYPEFYRFFLNKLVNLFPDVTNAITQEILKLISFKGLGKFSLLLYGLLSYQVFASLENAMNKIFKVKKKRNIFFSILISLTVVTMIIAFLILSFGAASAIPLLTELRSYFPGIRIGRITGFIIRFVVPFVLILFSVTSIYMLIPKAKVRPAHAFGGAAFTTTLLEAAKYIFTWYVVSVVHFGKIYGSLTAFVVFLLWMFYSSCIFLIGAEIVHNMGSVKVKKRGES
ncbi:MAG: YihY/virulence factor BrkB family protein [Nitrospirae bacterium]|nr:YihY/virulence factor BrkB family protein [Nitrospirota bacterium]